MEKEQANFVASTTNPIAKTTMSQLWEVIMSKGIGFQASSDQVSRGDYMEAKEWKAIQAGEQSSNGPYPRHFVLIAATFHYDPSILEAGDPVSYETCIVIHERYSDHPGFWVVSKPCDDSAFAEPGNSPFPNVDLLLKLISGEVKRVAGTNGHWTFKMHKEA